MTAMEVFHKLEIGDLKQQLHKQQLAKHFPTQNETQPSVLPYGQQKPRNQGSRKHNSDNNYHNEGVGDISA